MAVEIYGEVPTTVEGTDSVRILISSAQGATEHVAHRSSVTITVLPIIYEPTQEEVEDEPLLVVDNVLKASFPGETNPTRYPWLSNVRLARTATAGEPGSFEEDSRAPYDMGELYYVQAEPITPWSRGQYVVTGNGGEAFWSGVAGRWIYGRA